MASIVWGKLEDRKYESGLDHVVLYVDGKPAVPWNGVTGIAVSPTGGEPRPVYIDGVKLLNPASPEEPTFTIAAYSSPEEFDLCDGGSSPSDGVTVWQQLRRSFGFTFRTRVGNAITGELGYKVHVVHNALAEATSISSTTLADSVSLSDLGWKITTRNIDFPDLQPMAYFTLDSTKCQPAFYSKMLSILYGTDTTDPRLLFPQDILNYGGARYDRDAEYDISAIYV